jgi:hypothetical protein
VSEYEAALRKDLAIQRSGDPAIQRSGDLAKGSDRRRPDGVIAINN